MATITIDGQQYEVAAGKNLLQSCLELGLNLPYFCWHPAMGSVGACRQCAVVQYQNEEDTRGRIVMGCMTPVSDGAIFSLGGDKASGFREAIVESLMLNHPHDCPVCAEGGECHLQDMTVMVGHRDRHYRGRKNTHRNQYLGPLINHEMNRCITCYRCTRYYQDYAGGRDLAAMAAHDHIYFGRHEEGVLESPFAGNLVEVCPTGVFTDKALVHSYTRKWDLQSAPSVCTGCGLGCNTLPGERYGKLKRVHNRYNHEVNGYFLCDRGRFGGSFVNSDKRLDCIAQRQPDGRFAALHVAEGLTRLGDLVSGKRLAAIGSPRAAFESNLLLKQLVGSPAYTSGADDAEQLLLQRILAHTVANPAHTPSMHEMESADVVLVLGEDVTHTAPRVALALRQTLRNKSFEMAAELRLERWQDAAVRNLAQDQRNPLHIVAALPTDLDDVAKQCHYLATDDQARLSHAIADTLAGGEPADAAIAQICTDLLAADKPLIISGTAAASAALIDGAARIAGQLCMAGKAAMLSYCVPECNSLGAALLTRDQNQSFAALAQRAARGEIDTLLILENDLQRRVSATELEALRRDIPCWIGIDCLDNETATLCDLVLPAAAFSEAEGTYINTEGRAQRAFPVHSPAQDRRESWHWLVEIARARGNESLAGIAHFDDIVSACSGDDPLLDVIAQAAPNHLFRSHGLKIPRQPARYSGRTAMRANISVHEPKQTEDTESALAYTMEGAAFSDRPGALLSYVWSPGWNSNQSLQKFQSEIGGALRGGTAGVRLLDQLEMTTPSPAEVPTPFQPRQGELQLQAHYRIFGSDELSRHSPGIAELVGRAQLYLHPGDASALGVESGDGVTVAGNALELVINAKQTPGSASFSAGYPETLGLRCGQWVTAERATSWQRAPEVIGTDRGKPAKQDAQP